MKSIRVLLALAILMAFCAPALAGDTESGLIAHYLLDGSADDTSGHGFNGVVEGADVAKDHCHRPNGSLLFYGVDKDIVIIEDQPGLALPASFTISAFVLPLKDAGTQVIVDKFNSGADEREFRLSLKDGCLKFCMSDTGKGGDDLFCILGGTKLSLNTWHHVAATATAAWVKLYVDGELEAMDVTSIHPAQDGPSRMFIGGNLYADEYYFTGNIDDVRIYDRSLWFTEIKTLARESCQ